MADAVPPLLLFVVGPPAVGKMSVGQAIAERTGLRLFHNHISIELALRYFGYGTPAFHPIDAAIRRLITEEVAASDLPGLVFTYVWAFNLPQDQAWQVAGSDLLGDQPADRSVDAVERRGAVAEVT